jgi:protein SCO1/2
MKPVRVIAVLGVCLAALGATAILLRRSHPAPERQSAGAARSAAKEQVFDVRGRVISLDEHSGMVKIAHEEIPNYMPAMTMPFLVRDSNSLRKLKQGDMVKFKLAVTSDDSWISEIAKTAESAPPLPVAAPPEEKEDQRLKSGEKVPPFTFTDQNATMRNISDFEGKFVVLTFIYTRCPLPNFCPLLNKKFSDLQNRLSKEFPGRFHLISVSIDPANDTPAVLKGYASLRGADEDNWTFATGTAEQIAEMAKLFGLTYNQKNPGIIDHDLRTALINPDGRVVHIWKSNFWTPYEIRNRIDDENQSKQFQWR